MRYLGNLSYAEALCAVVRFGKYAAAAHYLGIPERTLANRLTRLRRRVGARNTAHLAAKLYPVLGAYYAPAHDRTKAWR